MAGSRLTLVLLLVIGASVPVLAQETRDLGLPPQSGSQYPVLPPPSGSQNPVLPPQSGQRYLPGVDGPFGDRSPRSPAPRSRPGFDRGVEGSLGPETQVLAAAEFNRLDEIAPALRRCWKPPAMDEPASGAMATVRFSLRRNGTIFGQPRVTWETRRGDRDMQERFSASVVSAVRDCAPLRLSQRLGEAIAGRPITIRFHGRAPSKERDI